MKKYANYKLFLILVMCLTIGAALSFNGHARTTASENSSTPYNFSLYWVEAPESAFGEQAEKSGDFKTTPALVLTMTADSSYHSYTHTSPGRVYPLNVRLDHALAGASVVYPPGRETRDIFEPDKTVHIYEGRTPVLLLFPDAQPAPEATLQISMLACSKERCVPIRTTLSLPPRPRQLPELLTAFPWTKGAWRAVSPVPLEGSMPAIGAKQVELGATTSVFSSSQDISSEQDKADTVSLFSPASSAPAALPVFSPRPFAGSLEVTGLSKAILFGLLAGLILNVMPCVLPVITLKINALLQGGSNPENMLRFRRHNFWFAIGILSWFAVLSLLFGLAGYAWGQIFQNNVFLLIMLGIVFILALTMFDVFHLPLLDLRGHQNGKTKKYMPRTNAFLTGLLATLLATPCSGPLLGGVLGWSLMQGLPILITIFIATGLGMALPYLGMALWPKAVVILPRPGNWMMAMERILGFLLLATCLYLLTILPAFLLLPALALLLTLAFSAWIWGTWGEYRAAGLRRSFLILLCAILPLGVAWIAFSPKTGNEISWKIYSPELFANQLGKRPLFVEFTADWCPTCKVLEQTTLTPKYLLPLVEENDLLLIRVDLTRDDPSAWTLLKSLGSASIPMLAVFPDGDTANCPVILRDIYTVEQIRGAVKQALHERP